MDTSDRLREHAEAREEWLAATAETLKQDRRIEDRRIEAAILYGSYGRGSTDVWSDVDLVVFVADSAVDGVLAERMVFPECFGAVVYRLDSTWNAPVDGAQVNAMYVLESGLPLYVDWNLWPRPRAGLPIDALPIFSRLPGQLPHSSATFADWFRAIPKQPRQAVDDATSEFVRHARFGMVPIAAKFAARRNRVGLVNLLTGIGAESVPEGVRGELSAIRECLTTLSPGESTKAVQAVQELCDVVQAYLGEDLSA